MPTVFAYGADYSAGELSPADLDAYRDQTGREISVLIRYIGYPDNTKCISHYPGAYQRHVDAGRHVLLVHEDGHFDARGGHDAGVSYAQRALEDANSIGYPAELPIFMASDCWLGGNGISIDTAMAFLDGAAEVLGRQRLGAYGFADFVYAAQDSGRAPWLWLCGDEAGVREGIHLYQWNNGRIYPAGMESDLNKIYVDPAVFSEGDFLMALEQWKQERIFERVLSMSQGVAGQNFDGDQFAREQAQRDALAASIEKLSQQVQALSDKIDGKG